MSVYLVPALENGGTSGTGIWILATSFWDDTGTWLDSESWID